MSSGMLRRDISCRFFITDFFYARFSRIASTLSMFKRLRDGRYDPSPTHFHSRLKTFLFCKSFPPQYFLFLLPDSLHGFPGLFTVISEHICFLLLVFFLFLRFLVVVSVR